MTHETILADLPAEVDRPDGGAELLGDALPLEIVNIDGRQFTMIWYYLSGVDRLSLASRDGTAGVIEGLEGRRPRLLPDCDWSAWFEEHGRAERVIAAAGRQWQHRGEIVADRALAEGGQS
ncbi:hypothetical protein [Glycomyces sp. NPDC021274]|uniref:hypothetical protein n=1 Tax=Glycomyces sp. NPDC021274 TaxID=3155120 RepID=UPI0033E032A9